MTTDLDLFPIVNATNGSSKAIRQMHEVLLQHQLDLGNGYLAEYADYLRLDVTRFARNIAKKVSADSINQDVTSGRRNGVLITPALFVNYR